MKLNSCLIVITKDELAGVIMSMNWSMYLSKKMFMPKMDNFMAPKIDVLVRHS